MLGGNETYGQEGSILHRVLKTTSQINGHLCSMESRLCEWIMSYEAMCDRSIQR